MSDASVVEKLVIEGDSSEAQSAADDMESHLTDAFTKGALGAKIIEEAMSKCFDVLKEGISLAVEHEAAVNRQRAALQSMGADVDTLSGQLQEKAHALKDLSGYHGDAISAVQTLALNFGVSAEKVDAYTRAAIELSNITGHDLNSSMMFLTRTQEGLADRTLSHIVGVKELTKEQLANGDAIKILNDRYGNLISEKMEGAEGAITRAKNSWSEFEKSIGHVVIASGPLISALDKITSALKYISEHNYSGAMGEMTRGGAGGATAAAAPVDPLGSLEPIDLKADKAQEDQLKSENKELFAQGKMALDLHEEIAKAAEKRSQREIKAMGDYLDYVVKANLKETEDQKKLTEAKEHQADLWAEYMVKAQQKSLDEQEKNLRTFLAADAKEQDKADKEWEKTHQDHAKEDKKLQGEMVREHKEVTDQIARGMESMAMVGLNALESLVQGNKVSGEAMLKDMPTSMGKQLVASGSKDMVQATAMLISSYGANPAGWALLATGAEELAGGLAMEAGTAWTFGGGGASGGSGGSSGGGNGGGSAYQGAQGTGSASSQSGQQQQRQLTIQVNGNLSPAETGAWIQKALNQASSQGLI